MTTQLALIWFVCATLFSFLMMACITMIWNRIELGAIKMFWGVIMIVATAIISMLIMGIAFMYISYRYLEL